MLCLSHCLSVPALSWNANVNMTKVELELISDAGMYIFFEKLRDLELLTFLSDKVKPKTRLKTY